MSYRAVLFADHEIGYRLLKKIIENQLSYNLELIAAVTTLENGHNWWPDVESVCKEFNIPLHRCDGVHDIKLDYSNIDFFFLFSWKYILSSDYIKIPKYGAINLHYSLLPENRGVYPINYAIINGSYETGVTYHYVNNKIDDGEIICQEKVNIYLSDTARILQLRLDDIAFDLFDRMYACITNNVMQELMVFPIPIKHSYNSRQKFLDSNQLDLQKKYEALELINLLRGKTFFPESRNLYFIEPGTGKKIYVSINLMVEDAVGFPQINEQL